MITVVIISLLLINIFLVYHYGSLGEKKMAEISENEQAITDRIVSLQNVVKTAAATVEQLFDIVKNQPGVSDEAAGRINSLLDTLQDEIDKVATDDDEVVPEEPTEEPS